MDIRLDGRVAVVTGGSKGLGLASARQFAASGADVAILARNWETLEHARESIATTARGRVIAVACDVSTAVGVLHGYEAVMDQLGRIDILMNNAGTSRAAAFETVTDEVWQEDLDLKLFAAIRLTRLVWPQLRERRWGRVINVLSIAAKSQRGNSSPTAISRAAGLALTKVLSAEGAPHGILVNALLVGLIISDQVVRSHRARGANMPLQDFIAKNGESVPLGRMGTAEEFANVACFLASDQAGYVTGTGINVDGGMSPVV